MKSLMILGASVLQLPAIIEARKMGIKTIVVDYNKDAIGFQYADIICVESTINTERVLELAKQYKPNGIITLASDMPMVTVATVCEELGLTGISLECAYKATNKSLMRKALKKFNVPIPKFYIVNNDVEYRLAISNFNEDFIVKPSDNSGSRGIFKVSDYEEAKLAYEYSRKYSRNGQVLVEEYMIGKEVSVETFTINGATNILAITDKETTGSPYFVETGHLQPSQQSIDNIHKIEDIARRAVEAIGIYNGPSHVEVKLTNEGPKIVEIGARMGGDFITTHLLPLSTGINMVKATINLAVGEPVDIIKKRENVAMIKFIEASKGVIKSIYGIDNAKEFSNIIEVGINKNIGDKIGEIMSSNDRLGYIISCGETFEDAKDAIEKSMKTIEICVEV